MPPSIQTIPARRRRLEIARVRARVADPGFPAPADGQSLRSWIDGGGRRPLAAVVTRVFGVPGEGWFDWEAVGAVPFFEEPEGDFDEGTLILVASDREDPPARRPHACVVVPLDLGGYRGRAGLTQLVDDVDGGLRSLAGASGPRREQAVSRR